MATELTDDAIKIQALEERLEKAEEDIQFLAQACHHLATSIEVHNEVLNIVGDLMGLPKSPSYN